MLCTDNYILITKINSDLAGKTTGYRHHATVDVINDATINVPYMANIIPTVAEAIGLPNGWYAIIHAAHAGTDGYCHQIAYSYTNADRAPKYRQCYAGKWTDWGYDWEHEPIEHYAITPAAGINIEFNIKVKQGVIYTQIGVVLPMMGEWSSITLGKVQDWKYGGRVLCTIHSLYGNLSSNVKLDITADGTVTANTQGAITASAWYYGYSCICA